MSGPGIPADVVAELKAAHGVVRAHKIRDEVFATRVPTIAELTEWMQAPTEAATEAVLGKLFDAWTLYPDAEALAAARKRIAALSTMLPMMVLQSCGAILTTVDATPEAEMSEALAAAFVEAEKKWAGDKLHPLTFVAGSFRYEAIVRDFSEREFRAYMKTKARGDFESFKETVRTVTVWGDSAQLEKRLPGQYLGILEFLSMKAGLAEGAYEGEL